MVAYQRCPSFFPILLVFKLVQNQFSFIIYFPNANTILIQYGFNFQLFPTYCPHSRTVSYDHYNSIHV